MERNNMSARVDLLRVHQCRSELEPATKSEQSSSLSIFQLDRDTISCASKVNTVTCHIEWPSTICSLPLSRTRGLTALFYQATWRRPPVHGAVSALPCRMTSQCS